jgi:hypothetical protein
MFLIFTLKGSVQRKLRWVENGLNPLVHNLDRGARHYFFIFVHLHLFLTIFPFLVSTAEFIGEFWAKKRSATSNVAPTVLALYSMFIGATSLPALKGEAERLRCANRQSAANSQRQ